MWDGKKKAVTFSYDDGVTQDKRLVEMLDRYGLKCTFNLNSELLGQAGTLVREGKNVNHTKVRPEEVKIVYAGHEVAAHTLTHPKLCKCNPQEIYRQVEVDRVKLGELVEYEVKGMAYPYGTDYIGDAAVKIVREQTGIQYARTTSSTYSFDLPSDLLMFHPTIYHMEWEKMVFLGEKFLTLEPDQPQLFYIWGHAYEFDIHDTWDRMESFCQMISGHEDIFYGTNREVFGI